MIRKLLVLAALAFAAPASAESNRWGTFQFSLSGYRPNIDAEFSGGARPYETAFGTGSNIMFRVDGAYSIFTGYGSLDVGLGLGYWSKTGRGRLPDGTQSADETGLKILPTRATLTYRFDVLANRYRWFPLAPYARVSFDRYWWWVTNGAGNLAKAGGRSGTGATNGYSFTGGVGVNLNALDPDLALDMDNSTGVNATYLFVEFTKSYISDFHSATSWNLSDARSVQISGGLMFVF